jgi:hypothetical protein
VTPVRKTFAWREDAIEWIKAKGFRYVNQFGWVHPEHGLCAIVEFTGGIRRPWVLTTYRSAVPTVQKDAP